MSRRKYAWEALSNEQNDDGSFGERQYRGNVAVTSLAGLALMAAGHQPGRGTYGKVVLEAVQFVLSQEETRRPGFLHNPLASPHGPMYGHGFGTLFLAEVHGMVQGKKLRDELHDKGVRIRFAGRRDWRVPKRVIRRMDESIELTAAIAPSWSQPQHSSPLIS